MSKEQSQASRALIIAVVILALCATAAGFWAAVSLFGRDDGPVQDRLRAGTLLPTPKVLKGFSLVDQDAKPYGSEDLRGHWTFIAFGYTSCPDVCPTTMATFAALAGRLSGEEGAPPARFLLISVDPERDDPARLAQYVRYFDPGFLGATGSHEQLRGLAGQLGVLYERVEGADTAMGYLVDHSASILLLDPQVRLAAIFGTPHDPRAMAEDFAVIAGL